MKTTPTCFFFIAIKVFHLYYCWSFDDFIEKWVDDICKWMPSEYVRKDDCRVIYFSDNVCNNSYRDLYQTVQGLADTYRSKYNTAFWVHGIDLQGYGTQQFCGNQFNLIAGWSESVLPFINLAESGVSTLVETIEKYEVNNN